MTLLEDQDDKWTILSYSEGKSNKFWRGLVIGNKYFVNYGKLGTNGTFNQKTFDSEEAAEKQLEKDIEVKQKKGYEISEDDE